MKKVFLIIGFILLLGLLVGCNPKCVESDDGNNPEIKGTLDGLLGGANEGKPASVEDHCYNETYLNEYYCVSNKGHYTMKKIECANSCVNGACV